MGSFKVTLPQKKGSVEEVERIVPKVFIEPRLQFVFILLAVKCGKLVEQRFLEVVSHRCERIADQESLGIFLLQIVTVGKDIEERPVRRIVAVEPLRVLSMKSAFSPAILVVICVL